MANIQDPKAIRNALTRVYEMLKFTPEEIEETAVDLAKVQQLAVSTELMKSLTEEEVKAINEAAQKSDAEKQTVIEQIAKAHAADDDFKERAESELKKVLDEHIAYLKTRGDDGQREAIAAILAEIE